MGYKELMRKFIENDMTLDEQGSLGDWYGWINDCAEFNVSQGG